MRKRKLLSRSSSIATRQLVYQVPEGLEVDDIDRYEVYRSRVLYEDVILMTFHRHRGVWFLTLTGALAAIFAAISMLVGSGEAMGGLIFFALTALPLGTLFMLRLLFGVDEINVYSRRSDARLRFALRKQHARRLFGEIAGQVRRRQEAMRRASAAADSSPPDVTSGDAIAMPPASE